MPVITKACEDYWWEVMRFAASVGLQDQFAERIKYLAEYANGPGGMGPTRCHLYKDFAPYSFMFTMERCKDDGHWVYWFQGGLIYHGPHDRGGDGGAPTFSVSLEKNHGWQVHT